MVTAILIPAICIYFYWISKKEMKENEEKWLALNKIIEEAILIGEIIQLTESKKRFYYHRYIKVIELQLKMDTKTISVKRITPYMKDEEPVSLKIGDMVRLYGNWQEDEFKFLRYEIVQTIKKELSTN